MDVNDIAAEIRKLKNGNDIEKLFDICKEQHRFLSVRQTANFHKGDTVHWDSRRAGMVVTGEVLKVNTKNIRVKTPTGVWNVPAAMLRKGRP